MESTFNVMDCCRTCLRVDCALISTEVQDSDSIKFFDKLVACVSEVSWLKDSLPLICSTCIDRLRVAYDFLIVCLESDQTLNRYISKLEINLKDHTSTTPTKFELALTSAATNQDSTLIKEEQQNSEYTHLKHDNDEEDLVDDVCEVERSSRPYENESNTEFISETDFVKQNSVIQDTISCKQPAILKEQSCQTEPHSQEDHSSQMQDASQEELINQQSNSTIDHNSEVLTIVTRSLPNVHRRAANATTYTPRQILKRSRGTQMRPPTPKQAEDYENGYTEFTCKECGKSYKKKSNLKIHLRTHNREKPVQCTVCSKRFTIKGELIMHMKTHTGEKHEEKHDCTCCDRRCLTSEELKVHMLEHTNQQQQQQQPYKCIVCQTACNCAFELESHMMTHTGEEFTCVTSAAYLAEHTRTHTKETMSTYDACDQFTRSQYLEKHMQTQTGKKPYPCFVCGKKFTLSSCLNVHLRIHTGEKPYYCNTCDTKFTTSS